MSGSNILQITIEHTFDELPAELSVSLEPVKIGQLVLPEDLYDTRQSFPETTVFNSINPLVVIPDSGTSYTIIDGCKRYTHAKKNNRNTLPGMIIQTSCNLFIKGLLRIALNLHRPIPVREQYLFLSWLKSNSSEKQFARLARQAGFTPKKTHQLCLLISCDNHVKEAVFNNALDISHIELFQLFSLDDQRCFLDTFRDLKLSLQTRREFLEWLPEIAYTRKSTIRDILLEPAITDTVQNSTLNAPQKIQKVHGFLYTQKFPLLTEARDIWKKQVAACNPDPKHVTFTPHEYFEKNQLTVSVSVTQAEQAAGIFKSLSAVSPEQWQTLLCPIQKK